MSESYGEARLEMVESQLENRGIDDPAVLRAFRTVPREEFVNQSDRSHAYDDRALPTEAGQTISQPFMVATMTQSLEVTPDSTVLEIGTGSGYQAAILAEMGAEIYTVERERRLSERAKEILIDLGYGDQIYFNVGDGTLGWPEHAPYDRVVVTAGAPGVPEPLKRQTDTGGRIVIPIGSRSGQTIKVLFKKSQEEWCSTESVSCVFVPLKGKEGWGNSEGSWS